MPIVQVQVWQGFGEDRARRLIGGITASFVAVGVPAGAVQGVIQEIPRSHWGVAGQTSQDRYQSAGEPYERSGRPGGYRGAREDDGEGAADRRERGDRGHGRADAYRPERDSRAPYGERSGRGPGDAERRPMRHSRTERPGNARPTRAGQPDRRSRSDSRPGNKPRRGASGGSSGEGSRGSAR